MVKIRLQGPGQCELETLWASEIGPNLYQLDNSPFFAYGISWQDVVEARPGEAEILEYVRIVRKSGNRTVRVIFVDCRLYDDQAQDVLRRIRELGCSYEGMQPRLVSINVPPEASLESLAAFLTEASGLQWEYADPRLE
jgi:hypothetical protein